MTGAAGVGKSRFLGALFDSRPDVLVLRARPGDAAVPLATLVRLVESLVERWPATSTPCGACATAQTGQRLGP